LAKTPFQKPRPVDVPGATAIATRLAATSTWVAKNNATTCSPMRNAPPNHHAPGRRITINAISRGAR
jgi:hypothetical protein